MHYHHEVPPRAALPLPNQAFNFVNVFFAHKNSLLGFLNVFFFSDQFSLQNSPKAVCIFFFISSL